MPVAGSAHRLCRGDLGAARAMIDGGRVGGPERPTSRFPARVAAGMDPQSPDIRTCRDWRASTDYADDHRRSCRLAAVATVSVMISPALRGAIADEFELLPLGQLPVEAARLLDLLHAQPRLAAHVRLIHEGRCGADGDARTPLPWSGVRPSCAAACRRISGLLGAARRLRDGAGVAESRWQVDAAQRRPIRLERLPGLRRLEVDRLPWQ